MIKSNVTTVQNERYVAFIPDSGQHSGFNKGIRFIGAACPAFINGTLAQRKENRVAPGGTAPYTDIAAMKQWMQATRELFRPLFDQLDRIEKASADWKRTETKPPNARSIDNARALLDRLRAHQLRPTRIIPSADGGVGILFQHGGRYADFECSNSGRVTRVTSDGKGKVTATPVHESFAGQRSSISDLSRFLNHE